MTRTIMSLAAAGLMAGAPAAAWADITCKPIVVAHSTNVNATAINKAGTIVGTYVSAKGGFGFVLDGHMVTRLPPLCQGSQGYCEANPTAINDSGTVTGFYVAGNTEGFVWQNGTYVTGDGFNAGSIPFQADILENASGEVAFNYNFGNGVYQPYAGSPSSPQQLAGLAADVSLINGLNDSGVVAGTTFATIGGNLVPAIFVGTSGAFKFFSPPGAQSVAGGVINDKSQVAGSVVDASNAIHGFVLHAGRFTYFEPPRSAASVAVNAINHAGRVAGVYSDPANNQQRGFLYNGSTLTVFGQYPLADTIHLALSDRGVLLLSDYSQANGTFSSYRGTCSGAGC